MATRLPPGFKITRDTNTEEFFINMGPQHPSTHGALRLALRMDGENIVEIVPHFGYIHRGMEKQAESMSYLLRNSTLAPQLEKTHETPPLS